MKVYVDELPKSCDKCPFNRMTFFWTSNVFEKCKATNECQLGFEVNCELQSLADYTKQVRKEVCEEIRKMLPNYIYSFQEPEVPRTKVIELEDVKYILDQIQGETK